MSILGRNISSFTQSLSKTATGAVGNAKKAATDIAKSSGLGKLLRLGPSSEPSLKTVTPASISGQDTDWRVKLSIPASFPSDSLLKPLVLTGGLVFPYTPTILIQHTANYNSLQPVHTNYPFYNYQSS
jgi:hypothetical protein